MLARSPNAIALRRAPRDASGGEDLVDFGDQVAEMKRLRQDLRVAARARFLGVQRHRREAGDEQHLHPRRVLRRPLGQFDAVDARHDDVGQQQVVAPDLERRQGLVAVAARGHQMSRAPERVAQKHAQGVVVFSKEYARHVRQPLVSASALTLTAPALPNRKRNGLRGEI